MAQQRIEVTRRDTGIGKVLVSGCLNGPPIRFNETNVPVVSPVWERWEAEGRLVPFCAELAAHRKPPCRESWDLA